MRDRAVAGGGECYVYLQLTKKVNQVTVEILKLTYIALQGVVWEAPLGILSFLRNSGKAKIGKSWSVSVRPDIAKLIPGVPSSFSFRENPAKGLEFQLWLERDNVVKFAIEVTVTQVDVFYKFLKNS